jgi:uncharacterized protein
MIAARRAHSKRRGIACRIVVLSVVVSGFLAHDTMLGDGLQAVLRAGLKTRPYHVVHGLFGGTVAAASLQPEASALPELLQPVNDFAHVIDPANAVEIDRMIRTLKTATGDVVVVTTVPTIAPYGDIREYANELFENHGRGIGEKGKDNGLLIVLALAQRRVQIEVGYELEQWITDGFSGETSREYMAPAFREGRYGDGLRIGTERIIGRIAQGRGVQLDGVRVPRETPPRNTNSLPFTVFFVAFIVLLALSRIGRGSRRGMRTWGRGGWSGWSSGVGPFGGGWSGGGGGFGGGFDGFGGGRSGGGGGGAGW